MEGWGWGKGEGEGEEEGEWGGEGRDEEAFEEVGWEGGGEGGEVVKRIGDVSVRGHQQGGDLLTTCTILLCMLYYNGSMTAVWREGYC